MTVKECYERMGADYDDALRRLTKEERLKKFLIMFYTDENFAALVKAMDEDDGKEAFRAAHTLKGICGTLGLGPLTAAVDELTEALRSHEIGPEQRELFEEVKAGHVRVMDAIGRLREDPE